jgi:xylulokinase
LKSLFSFLEARETYEDDIKIIGGGALSNNWCQIIADICGKNVLRPINLQESTSFGAAVTGGVGVGIFNDFNVVNKLLKIKDKFYPDKKKIEKYKQLYSIFLEVSDSVNDLFKKIAAIKN